MSIVGVNIDKSSVIRANFCKLLQGVGYMLQIERQKNILEFIEKKKSTTVSEIAKAVYTSEASVRRDIVKLEKEGYIIRVYGGVMPANHQSGVVPVELRDTSNSKIKEEIAKKAASLIKSGDTVIMDASTTVFRICHYIKTIKNLKVITNNLRICEELKDTEIKVYCTGGAYYGSRGCFLGAFAENFISSVHADKVFFSSQGISCDGIITDVDESENSIRSKMLEHADKKIFLCDSSKYGLQKPFTLCNKDDIDEIICDKKLVFDN